MKAGAMLLIAAMLAAPFATLLSTSTTTAAPDPVTTGIREYGEVEFRDSIKLKDNISTTIELYVEAAAGETITDVKVVAPLQNVEGVGNPITDVRPLVSVPKDNLASVAEVLIDNDNWVLLPEGTIVRFDTSGTVSIPENTEVAIPDPVRFYEIAVIPVGFGEDDALATDITAEIKNIVVNIENGDVTAVNDFTLTVGTENISPVADVLLNTDNGIVRLVEDTWVYWENEDENIVRVVSDTRVEVTENVIATLGIDNVLELGENRSVSLNADNTADLGATPEDNEGRVFVATSGDGLFMSVGDNFVIKAGGSIILTPGTNVTLEAATTLRILENTEVIRKAGENLWLHDPATVGEVENVPVGWTQTFGITGLGEEYVEWENDPGITGENLIFPFGVTLPETGGEYEFKVYINDATTPTAYFSIIIDNKAPTVTISVSPDWVKGGTSVTITLTGDEAFKFDNVFVQEGGPDNENFRVEMSPATENAEFDTTWTGTYTVKENENLVVGGWADGWAYIYVDGIVDEVGKDTVATEPDALFIDRRVPGKLNMGAWTNWPEDVDNESVFEISATTGAGNALTYNLDNIAPWVTLTTAQQGEVLDGMEVELLVNDNVLATADVNEYGEFVFTDLELPQGRSEIGVRLTDRAGNVGEENLENVIIDSVGPSVNISVTTAGGVTVSEGGFAPENEVVITVTISDATLGIENLDLATLGDNLAENFIDNENFDRGYVVIFEIDNGDTIPGIENIVKPEVYPVEENVENVRPGVFLSYTFENATAELPELPAGRGFLVTAYAGDSMNYAYDKGSQRAVDNFLFYVDIRPPDPPTLTYQYPATTLIEPEKTTTAAWYMAGTTEPGATIIIYITRYNPDGTLKAARAQLTTVSADPTTGDWEYTLDIKGYEGEIVFIETAAKDQAGNEGDRSLYGYFMYDKSPPTVTLDIEEMTTGEEIVVITGSVTPDAWETYADITIDVAPVGAGYSYDPATGNFQISVPLREGRNLVGVTATDPLGNSSSDSATIIRTVTPWATYAIIVVVIALILAAIAIFRRT